MYVHMFICKMYAAEEMDAGEEEVCMVCTGEEEVCMMCAGEEVF